MGGLYDVPLEMGRVYFEITVNKLEGLVVIGTTCGPYPVFRFPMHSAEGRDYMAEEKLKSGDVIGRVYEFGRAAMFFTYNGGCRMRHIYANFTVQTYHYLLPQSW